MTWWLMDYDIKKSGIGSPPVYSTWSMVQQKEACNNASMHAEGTLNYDGTLFSNQPNDGTWTLHLHESAN